MKKTLKFRKELAQLILDGKKNTTWRLFDDKNLSVGDEIELVNWDTHEVFADAVLLSVREKKMKELVEEDFDGHETFPNEEEMYATYRSYYGEGVGPDTIVKIIRFEILSADSKSHE